MGDYPYPKSNLKILGHIFKMHRIELNYSLRGIARSEKIAHTMISDIETGKIYPNVETLERLFKNIAIDLLVDLEVLRAVKEDIDMFYEGVYHKDNHFIKSCYDKVLSYEHNLLHSLVVVDFKLFQQAYNSSYLGIYDNKVLKYLEQFYGYFSDEQKHRFNLIFGVNLIKTNQHSQGFEYLKRNIDLKGSPKEYGITMSYIAKAYQSTYNIHNAIHYATLASEIHGNYANLPRKIDADLIIVKNLIEAERFDDGQVILMNIMLTIAQDTPEASHFQSTVTFLRSYLLYRKNHLDDALTIIESQPIEDLVYSCFYKALIFYHMEDRAKAVEVLEQSLNLTKVQEDFLFSRLTPLFVLYLTNQFDDAMFEKYVLQLIENNQYIKGPYVYRLVHKIAIEYYDHHKKPGKALEIAKKYMFYKKVLS